MTEKRVPSERPPIPSVRPPTDDIDSEWDDAEQPAPAVVTAQRASVNPLRKQTLLGIAPVIPPRASVPAPEPVAAPQVAAVPEPAAAPSVTTAPVPATSVNPLRKQTLMGFAPPVTGTPVTSDIPKAPRVPTATTAPKQQPVALSAALSDTDEQDLAALRSRRGRLAPWLLAAAAALALGYLALDRDDGNGSAATEARAAAPATAAPQLAERTAVAVPDEEPAPVVPDPIVPNGVASAKPAASTDSAEVRRVSLVTDPPGARLFWKGKEVGTTPFVVELPAGQRRSYELGLPGHVTRKLVIDGSKTQLSIGMRPDSAAP